MSCALEVRRRDLSPALNDGVRASPFRSFETARWLANAVLYSFLVVACGGGQEVPAPPYALPGDTDKTFANDGTYVYPRAPFPYGVNTHQILVISGGRLLALGGMGAPPSDGASFQSSASFALTSSGAMDGTFGQEGLLPAAPATAGAQEFVTAQQLRDGSLVLASKIHTCGPVGSCAMDDPGPTYRVQRYLSTGKLDASYAQAGTFTTPSHAGNAAILTDGTTISLGATYYRTFISGLSRPFSFHAVVVDATGQPDSALADRFLAQMIRCSPSGTADVSSAPGRTTPVVQRAPDDRIIFAFGSCMLKLNRDATPDSSFGVNGLSNVDNAGLPVRQILILQDGTILAFSVRADGKSYQVVKRLPNGSPDPAFGAGGVLASLALPFTLVTGPNYPLVDVPNTRGFPALDRSGRFLIAGRGGYLARLDAGLNLDTSFGSAGSGVTALGSAGQGTFEPATIAVDEMNRIILGGSVRTGTGSQYSTYYAEAVTRLYGEQVAGR